MMWK